MAAPPTGILFYEPRAKPLSVIGLIQPGSYYQFYLTQTLTLTNVYADGFLTTPLSQVPGTGGTTAASDGRLVPIYLNPTTIYRVQLYSAVGVLLEDVDPYVPQPTPVITATEIGTVLYPRTTQEIAASVTPTNIQYPDGNVLRYGADPTGATDSTFAFQQASFTTYAGWVPNTQPRVVFIPAGRYKFLGANTAYGTATIFIRSGESLIGAGQGSVILDFTAWGAVATDAIRLGWGFIGGVAVQDSGGFAPETYGYFTLGGPSAGGAVVGARFAGALVHDIFFSGPGLGIFCAGAGLISGCTFDVGLAGIAVDQTANCVISGNYFYNQNYAIELVGATGDTSDILIADNLFAYTQFASILMPANTNNIRGIKVVGCLFTANAQYSTFQNFVQLIPSNLAQIEFDSCEFRNWGAGGAGPYYAIGINGTGTTIVDVKNCIFDGQKSNAAYTPQSTATAGILLQNGSLSVTDSVFRNLNNVAISISNSAAVTCKIDGMNYTTLGSTAISMTNTNGASVFSATNVVGDGVSSFINPQSLVLIKMKNMVNWFAGILTAGASNYVVVPYQFSNIYSVCLTANINSGGSANYSKSTLSYVEKDNDFNGAATSFITSAVAVQGASQSGSGGNGVISLSFAFTTPTGGASIANSNSGQICIFWPNTYSSVSLDIQPIGAGIN